MRDQVPQMRNWLMICAATLAAVVTTAGAIFYAAALLASYWRDEPRATPPGVPEFAARTIAGPPATTEDEVARTVASQEAMASLAFWMLVTAIVTVCVTTAGTVAIFRQIRFGQQALEEARSSNAHAADTARRQLRAYLNITFEERSGEFSKFAFVIHNSGQTPAMKVFYYIELYYISNHDGVVDKYETDDFAWTNIAANQSYTVVPDLPRPNLTPKGQSAPEYDFLQIAIDCTYYCIFNDEHTTRIAVNRRGWSDFWMEEEETLFT